MILLTVAHACPLRTVRILTLSHGRSRFATNGDANAVPPRATRTFRLAMLIAISRALDHYEQYHAAALARGNPPPLSSPSSSKAAIGLKHGPQLFLKRRAFLSNAFLRLVFNSLTNSRLPLSHDLTRAAPNPAHCF